MIKIPKTYMGKPVKGALEKVLAEAPVQTPNNIVQSPADIQISNINDAWQISGVEYRNGIYIVDLAKSLLENGNAKTQDEWAERYESVKDKGEFYTPDYPLFYGVVKAAKTAGNDEIRNFIKDTSRARGLMTLTRAAYTPRGLDKLIHNYGTSDRYEEDVDFITPDGKITQTGKPASYQALLGTKDSVGEINEVFKWLNGTDTFAWKVNNKPDKLVERVAWFYADSDWVGLCCGRNPVLAVASLGVRAEGAGAQKI